MTIRYYAHFVTDSPEVHLAGEYSGVVELAGPLRPQREMRELRSLLARNFELEAEDIRILDWACVH
ncbi:MAG: hypothetical protein RL030_137 [Pseudomonadota bacterium]|jgi:hypothetical protein